MVMSVKQENMRNFSIIAHIDHGKSTLADRILEETGAITEREKQEQLLDNMDIERERGITIKLNAVQLSYHYQGEEYILHLIDTPGHVDFTYEVSRSLAACEGALLVVDAAQGIEAQTLANLYQALDNNLTIIPVINKIDLPNADIDKVKRELMDTIGFDEEEILLVSAKTGVGIQELIEAIIERIPSPHGKEEEPLQALIFDSYYDSYRGIVTLLRVMNGSVHVGDKIKMMATNATYEVVELGIHSPYEKKVNSLKTGEVGYLCASIKSIEDVKVGDTITLKDTPAQEPLAGYKPMKPMVFCGIYPVESSRYPELREALEKLKLNDASLQFEPETSQALGFGFRCGFLGLLHMEIIEERIEREFNIDLIATSPSVVYEVELPSNMYPGSSDERHFQEANKQLYNAFQADPEFAQLMESIYPGIVEGVKPGKRGAFSRKAPTKDVTWHHEATRSDILQLIPIEQHRAKGKIQSILHPQGRGGMENWGGGRKRKK